MADDFKFVAPAQPTPPDDYKFVAPAPASPTYTGSVPVQTDPFAELKEFGTSLGKLPVGLAAGGAQLLGDVTPNILPAGTPNPVFERGVKYATSPNKTWGGTAGEILGGLPLLAEAIPAAVAIGGAEATPSGSIPSHLVGAGTAAATGGILKGVGVPARYAAGKAAQAARDASAATHELRAWLADKANAARRAGQQTTANDLAHLVRSWTTRQVRSAQDATPTNTTREWYHHIYEGTGARSPVDAVTPGSLRVIQNDIGGRLNAINQRFALSRSSISSTKLLSDRVRNGLTEAGRVEWQNIYAPIVERMGSDLEGPQYAQFLSDLRVQREGLARRASGQSGDSDDWKMVRGLREIQQTIEREAEGSAADKAERARWTGAYHKWAILNDATGAGAGGIATPRALAKSWENHSGNYGADYATNSMKQRLERLRRVHEATKPSAGKQPRPVKPADVGKRPTGKPPPPPRPPPGRFEGALASLAHHSPSGTLASIVAEELARRTGVPTLGAVQLPLWAMLSQSGMDEPALRALFATGRGARAAGGAIAPYAGPVGTAAGLATAGAGDEPDDASSQSE